MNDYLKSLLKVLAIGATFASIPFFASLASLQPPWPPAIGFVSAALVLLGALVAWEWTRNTQLKKRRRAIVFSCVGLAACIMGYLVLYSMFVVNVDGSEDLRVIVGYECNERARIVFSNECPQLTKEALEQAEWDPVVLWTRESLTVVRVSLSIAWIGFTCFLISAVGSIIAGRKF